MAHVPDPSTTTSTFTGPDGTRLALHRRGGPDPLVCLPGGPMQAAAYLGDLGGLVGRHPTARLDLRGTGGSEVPTDPASFRCDRQVEDVDALRRHLDLDRLDLLGHSAGAAVAVLYAVRYPGRVRRLVLVTPSPRVVGVEVTDDERREVALRRSGQPWFDPAYAALRRIWSGVATDTDWDAITPFSYGRWDGPARAHHAGQAEGQNTVAAGHYYSAGGPDPAEVRGALHKVRAPVLLLAGADDVVLPPPCAARYAALFPAGRLLVQRGAGHFPWLDDPVRFRDAVLDFLSAPV